MGINYSTDLNHETQNSPTLINDNCFSPETLIRFFNEYNKRTTPQNPEAKAEPFLFTIICDKLFSNSCKPSLESTYFHPSSDNNSQSKDHNSIISNHSQNNSSFKNNQKNIEALVFETINKQLQPFLSQINFFSDRYSYIINKLRTKLHNEPIKFEKSWQNTCQSLCFDKGANCEVPFVLGATFSVFFELLPEIDNISEDDFNQVLTNLLMIINTTHNSDNSCISPQLISKFNACLVSIATRNVFKSLSIRTKIIAFLLRVAEIDGGITTVISSLNVALSIPADSDSHDLYLPKLNIYQNLPQTDFKHWLNKWNITHLIREHCQKEISEIQSITSNEYFVYFACTLANNGGVKLFSFDIKEEKFIDLNFDLPEKVLLTIDEKSIYICDIHDSENVDITLYSLPSLKKYSTLKGITNSKNCPIISICFFNTELFILSDEGGTGNYTLKSYHPFDEEQSHPVEISSILEPPPVEERRAPSIHLQQYHTDTIQFNNPVLRTISDLMNPPTRHVRPQPAQVRLQTERVQRQEEEPKPVQKSAPPAQSESNEEEKDLVIPLGLVHSVSISTPCDNCTLMTDSHNVYLISPNSKTMMKVTFKDNSSLQAEHIPSYILSSESNTNTITCFGKFTYIIDRDENNDFRLSRFDSTFGQQLTYTEIKKTDNSNTFSSFIEDIVLLLSYQLTSVIPALFNQTLQDSDSSLKKAIQFFITQNPEETLLSSLDLGIKCMQGIEGKSTYPKSVLELILLFCLQVITCSLRFYTFRFPYDHTNSNVTNQTPGTGSSVSNGGGDITGANFSSDDQFIDKHARAIFRKLRNFIQSVTESDVSNTSIISAAFQVVNAGFKYLYNPYYTEFADLVEKLSKKGNGLALSAALPFLKGSSALIYSVNPQIVETISRYHPPYVVSTILSDQIQFINNELFFISGHKYNVEHCIGSFVSSAFEYFSHLLCFEDILTRKQECVDRLLQLVARVLSMNKRSVIILGQFSQSCLTLLKNFLPYFKASDLSLREDTALSKPLNCATKVRYESKVFETQHPYPPKQDQETPFEMCGASEIRIEFDPQCATEATTDYLQIFDKSEGGSSAYKTLTGPAGPGWPRDITIQSDTCRFLFHSEESTSDWGIKCIISANVPITEQIQTPSLSLLIINLLCFALGWSIENIVDCVSSNSSATGAGISVSSSTGSGLISMASSSALFSSSTFITAKPKELTEEEQKFLEEVSDHTKIHPLVTALRGKMRLPKSNQSRFLDDEMDCIVIASILRQTNLVHEAMQFMETGELTQKLTPIARPLMTLKTFLRQRSQPVVDRDEDSSSVDFIENDMRLNIIKKAQYFLKHEYLNKSVNDFTSILRSDKPLYYYFEQWQEEEANKNSIGNVSEIIEEFLQLPNVFHTGKIAFISQLVKAATIASESQTTFPLMLSMLVSDIPNALQLFLLRSILIHKEFDIEYFETLLNFLTLHYKANTIEEHVFEETMWLYLLNYILQSSSIEEFLQQKISLKQLSPNSSPSKEVMYREKEKECSRNALQIFSIILELLSNKEKVHIPEMAEYKLTMILSLLITRTKTMTLDSETLQKVLNLIFSYKTIDTPRHFCSLVRLMSSILANSNRVDFPPGANNNNQIMFLGQEFTLNSFVVNLFDIIAEPITQNRIDYNKQFDRFSLSSHQYISSELILCIRYIMNISPQSVAANEINNVIVNALEKNQASKQLLSTFTILGGSLHPHSQNCYSLTDEGKLFCITETSPLSEDVYGFLVDTLEFTRCSKSNIIPCSIISPPKFNFTKHVQLFYDIHRTFIEQPSNCVSCMRCAVISSFYTLLPIILQDKNLSSVFENNLEFLISLLNFANSPTGTEKFDTLPGIISTLNYFMYVNNHQVNMAKDDADSQSQNMFGTSSGCSPLNSPISKPKAVKSKHKEHVSQYTFDNLSQEQTDPVIPFSMSKKHKESPTTMACIFGSGRVNGRTFHSSSLTSLFVGDRTLDGVSPFYFEVTLIQSQQNENNAGEAVANASPVAASESNMSFCIGFADTRDPIGFYQLSLPSFDVSSPTGNLKSCSEQMHIHIGDTFGVGYAQSKVIFFVNGRRLSQTIDYPPFGEFIPFLLDKSGGQLTYSINFGQEAFMKGVLQDPVFGCERFHSESFAFTNSDNVFVDDDFDKTTYETSVQQMITKIDPPNAMYNKVEAPSKNSDQNKVSFSVKTPTETKLLQLSLHSPVLVYRIRINPNEAMQKTEINIPQKDRHLYHKMGIVKDIQSTSSGIMVSVQFYNATTGQQEQSVISSSFLSPVDRHRFKGTDYKNKMHTESSAAEGLYYTRKLSIRSSRYAILMIIYNNPMMITKLWNSSRLKKISSLFSILNIELNDFTPNVQIDPGLITTSQFTPMDVPYTGKLKELLGKTQFLIFDQTNQHWFFFGMMKVAIHNLSPDLSASSHGQSSNTSATGSTSSLPTVTQQPAEAQQQQQNEPQFISFGGPQTASNLSMSGTLEQQRDSHDSLFEKAKPYHKFVSPENCNIFNIDCRITVRGSVGFIVPIHSDNRLPQGLISVNGVDLNSLQKDVKFLHGDTVHVKGYGNLIQDRRVKFSVLPVMRHMTDLFVNTPIGSFHILMTILTYYFSFLERNIQQQGNNSGMQSAKNYLRDLLPMAVKLMMSKGLISRLVAFEIIAPILSRLDWSENDEDTFSTNNDISNYMKSFTTTINDKDYLTPSAEQAIMMNIMLDLNKLHSVEQQAIADRSKIGAYLNLLLEMYSRDPKSNFDKLCQSFMKVSALTHNWNFPIRFPSFLLIDDFMKKDTAAPIRLKKSDFVREGEISTYQYKSDVYESILITFKDVRSVQIGSVEAQNNTVYKVTSTKISVPSDASDTFELTITPQDLLPNKKLQYFEEHFSEFLSLCENMRSFWTSKMDEELLHALRNRDSEHMSDDLDSADIVKFPVLRQIDPYVIRVRIHLVKKLHLCMDFLVSKVNLQSNSLLATGILSARSAIATCHKQNIFKDRVNTNLKDNSRLHLRFNRSRAILHMERPDHPSAVTLLRQLIEQVPLRLIDSLKRDSVPWHVDLIGEGATDAGGPSRDIFTQMCQEIVHPSTGLFICSPNTQFLNGTDSENVDRYIPNPNCPDEQMFEYAGVLMTIAYVSRMPQPFRFAEFVWRFLTGHPLTIEDIYSTDSGFANMIRTFEQSGAELIQSNREYVFTVVNAAGQTKELIPNGSQKRVTLNNLSNYIMLCKEYRLHEMQGPLESLRKGIYHFFPPDAVSLLSSWELELFVSGDTNVSVEELKKCCKYDIRDQSSIMLWHVLEKFTPTERMLFIKFATGRMGLPSPGMSWHSALTITWSGLQGRSDENAELPTAQTCSSTIRIPRYTSEEAMAKKIRTAVLYGGEIVNDRTQNVADIVQLS